VIPNDTDNNPDTVSLDNAMLAGPDVAVTPPVGKVTRVLTLGRSRWGKFLGVLIAEGDYSCAANAKVSVFEVRKGKAPLKVGTVAPRVKPFVGGTATFSLKVKAGAGRYYATVAKAKSSLDGNTCSAAKSRSVKVS
jgi:hypothetical protein